MITRYRLVVSSPTTQAKAAKTWEFSQDSGNVISIETLVKRDKHRLSSLTARIHDPDWSTFSALPDPAFEDVPVTLYLGKPGNAQDITYTVFQGKVTQLTGGFPGPQTLQIEAHDNSIDMRKQARAKTYAKKTSAQIAKQLASDYGFDIDIDIPGVILAEAKNFSHLPNMSDWEHLSAVLAADGLECHVDPKTNKIVVRQAASKAYGTTFKRGEAPVIKLEVKIAHVHGPGKGGDVKTAVAAEVSGGAQLSATGSGATELAKEKAQQKTYRHPAGLGTTTAATGAHTEDRKNPWTNMVTNMARRKDTAVLTCLPIPDISLANVAVLSGWGAKADGNWYLDSIHTLISGESARTTTLTMQRAPSKGAAKQSLITAESTFA